MEFLISFSIEFLTELTVRLFKIIELGAASFKPPLFDIIVAQPLLDASNATRPKGSSHLEQTTDIFDFDNQFKTELYF